MAAAVSATLTFMVNGTQHEVRNPDPLMTLNEWLRSQRGLTGTKVMCGEGGCGCCVVMVTHPDQTNGGTLSYTVNSCLCPLCSVDGWTITTVEGLGGQKAGFHPIQRRLADFNGSQCGYCSPGMVVNMYGLLSKKPQPSQQEVENHFDGHICRCTGYRPILDAMKSFANDAGSCIDIEDLNKHLCPVNGQVCNGAATNGVNGVHHNDPPLRCSQNGVSWYRPTTLEQLYSLLEQHSTSQDRYKLVCGNTAAGVYKTDGPFTCLIDVKSVAELYITQAGPPLVVGSAVSLSTLVDLLQTGSDQSPSYSTLAEHLLKVANVSVRNVGSWAGNLMMKHAHPEFPSDVFTIMEAAGAKVTVGTRHVRETVGMVNFLKMGMAGKLILSMEIPAALPNEVFKTFKVMPRSQNAHAYVTAGFRVQLGGQDSLSVVGKPSLVFGGISKTMDHAVATEDYLVGKNLLEDGTLKGALSVLENELKPDGSSLVSPDYRKSLAITLFYKFYLYAVGKDHQSEPVRSALEPLVRPVSRGEQHFQTKESEWPVNQPLPKLASKLQASGEAIYINDLPSLPGEVYAAYVTSTVANCKLGTIDSSQAMTMPGAVACLTASDVPGINNHAKPMKQPEEILCSGEVLYAGQPVALVVADTQSHADAMAKAVKVTYTDLKPPILTIQDAIAAQSFFPSNDQEVIKGDAEGAIAAAPHVVTGEVSCDSQYHFHMETQVCRCTPLEDGMEVQSSTQALDTVQNAVSQVTGLAAHRIYVSVKRVGGGFGGKLNCSCIPASACAVAAHVLNRPVCLSMSLSSNMEVIGKRAPYLGKYKVGFDDEGKLLGVDFHLYENDGCSSSDTCLDHALDFADSVYFCPNWRYIGTGCKTNIASTTMTRAPGAIASHFFMEHIMDHVASSLDKDPGELRRLNMFQTGHRTLLDNPITDNTMEQLWDDLVESAEVQRRKEEIAEFNKTSRWKKRGLSMVPIRYPINWSFLRFTVFVAIYHSDGSVVITHGGIEMGQGINTKVMQVAAATLGVPMETVHVMATNSLSGANSSMSGGSVSSELNCKGVLECCRRLNERINPIRQEMGGAPKWTELINMCHRKGVDLSEKYMEHPPPPVEGAQYSVWGATCTEAELDVLTGEREITRVDIIHDSGESLNPEIDVGQVEGGFVFGLGYWLTEECRYDRKTGQLITNGTWEYKPPTTKDIPIDLRVTLLPNAPNPHGVLRSKACGEPPLLMSCSALLALRQAVGSARADVGRNEFFPLDGPATVEVCQQKCLVDPSDLKL